MSVILGIDLGTSSVKAMLLDSVKGVISVESSPYEVSIPFEGYAEQNPETWWLETKQVLGRLRDKNEQEFNEIQAVGFSGQMHGIVVADCEGKPLRPAILWLDQRSRKELESINSVLDFREMGEIFRNRAFTGFAFPSLMWLKEHEPEVLLKAGAVLMPNPNHKRCYGQLNHNADDNPVLHHKTSGLHTKISRHLGCGRAASHLSVYDCIKCSRRINKQQINHIS